MKGRAVSILAALGATLGWLAAAGCAASEDERTVTNVPDGSLVGDTSTIVKDDGGTPGPTGKSVFYVHTEKTLYEIDPLDKTLALKKLGDVDCMNGGDPAKADSSLTDIAVSRDGQVYGVSSRFAYELEVQSGTVHCKNTWTISKEGSDSVFYGLTFAPIGTLSATEEVLIAANNDGQMYTLDQTTGKTTYVGNFGSDPKTKNKWNLSGDIVFLENNGNPIGFATVNACAPGKTCTVSDSLIELDVKAIKPGASSTLKGVRGQLVKGSWCTTKNNVSTFDKMFGIVAYEDRVFGFSDSGYIVEISNIDGSACLITNNTGMKFKGAGIATSAPVVAVPN